MGTRVWPPAVGLCGAGGTGPSGVQDSRAAGETQPAHPRCEHPRCTLDGHVRDLPTRNTQRTYGAPMRRISVWQGTFLAQFRDKPRQGEIGQNRCRVSKKPRNGHAEGVRNLKPAEGALKMWPRGNLLGSWRDADARGGRRPPHHCNWHPGAHSTRGLSLPLSSRGFPHGNPICFLSAGCPVVSRLAAQPRAS